MKSIFNFCPNCKSEKILTKDGHKYLCAQCDFEFYHNVASAVAVILECEDEIMFTIRNLNPSKGKLDLPGGFVDFHESANQTIIRELKEELNLNLSQEELTFFGSYPNEYLYRDILYHTLDLGFIIKISKDRIGNYCKSEIQDIIWSKKNQIIIDNIAFSSTKQFILDYLKRS